MEEIERDMRSSCLKKQVLQSKGFDLGLKSLTRSRKLFFAHLMNPRNTSNTTNICLYNWIYKINAASWSARARVCTNTHIVQHCVTYKYPCINIMCSIVNLFKIATFWLPKRCEGFVETIYFSLFTSYLIDKYNKWTLERRGVHFLCCSASFVPVDPWTLI